MADYNPGRDHYTNSPTYSPSRGAGGQFARDIQGSTPKFAYNARHLREALNKNTLARLFVRINPSEAELFKQSVGDEHTRRLLVPQLVGDMVSRRRRGEGIAGTGYVDFFLSQCQRTFQEKVQITETLSDNYVAYTFGMAPPIWTYQGTLLNTVQDDQASNFTRLYLHILRATQLARRQKVVSLRYDDGIVTGIFLGFSDTLSAGNEAGKPFQFQLLVKRLSYTNYTEGWTPTQPEGAFAADRNAVPFDGQVREASAMINFAGLPPNGFVQGPQRDTQTDARENGHPSPVADAHQAPLGPVATAISSGAMYQAGPVVPPRPPTRVELPPMAFRR